MQLNISTDYGIRLVLSLATSNRVMPASEISEMMKIPKHYLYNIINEYQKVGLIKGVRGSKGGYSINKNPKDITLYQVISVMEGSIKINRCLEEDGYCSRDGVNNNCPVHSVYTSLQVIIEERLKNITILDLVKKM